MANLLGIRQVVVDAGIAADALPRHPDLRYLRIGRGTRDISQGPAMSSNQAIRCVEGGINLAVEIANAGADLIGIGDMGMRLGEGTGAVLAMPIVEAAAACLSKMSTFDEAGVSTGVDVGTAHQAPE